MICAILGRGRHAALLQEWKEAADAGAELVELRVDCLRRDVDLKRLLKERHTPLIFTVRRGADGGLWRGEEEKRQRIIREAIIQGIDYVDLEMDIASSVPRFGRTKRIISYHNFKKTPKELPQIIEQMEEMKADIIKVAVTAHTLQDAVYVLECASKAEVPTIAIAMGEIGFFTRILTGKYGAPFTYSGFNPDRTFATGLPSFRNVKRDYFYDEINENTEVYAVVGDPIAQSLSPAVHNNVFRMFGQNKVYVPIKVPPESLKGMFEILNFLDIKGYSVTIPHKEDLISLLDQYDEVVEFTEACNTIEVKDGKRIGHNTDYQAALDTMEEALGGKVEGLLSPLQDKQALVLGAGGAARAVAHALIRSGAGVTLVNRNDDRSARLAAEVGCKTASWTQRASSVCDIMVNCTPVGMHPQVDSTPVPPAGFRENMLVFDTVYHPENTMFLKLGKERNCRTASGVEMFVRQAAAQSRIFTGENPPMDLIRKTVRNKFSPLTYE